MKPVSMTLRPKAERGEEGRRDRRACARKYAPREGGRTLLAWRGAPWLRRVSWPYLKRLPEPH